jgi:hypothetical protein
VISQQQLKKLAVGFLHFSFHPFSPQTSFLAMSSTLSLDASQANYIRKVLQYDNHANRDAMAEFMAKDPLYIPRYNIPLATERELALNRLVKLAKHGFWSVFDFEKNPLNVFAGTDYTLGMLVFATWCNRKYSLPSQFTKLLACVRVLWLPN